MRIAILVLWLMAVILLPVAAQDGYPLPDDLALITPANAASVQQLASIGEPLAGRLLWSPDNAKLVVQTSEAVHLYDASDFTVAPTVIPVYSDIPNASIYFNAAGELVIQWQRYDLQTGALLGAVELPSNTNPIHDIAVEVVTEDGQTVLELTKSDGTLISLALNSNWQYQQLLFNDDASSAAVILGENDYAVDVQLWNLESGQLVMQSQLLTEMIATLTFHGDGNLLIAATYTDAPYGNVFEGIQIWDGRTGEELFRGGYLPVVFSPDKETFAFLTDEGISVWDSSRIGTLTYPDEFYAGEERRPIVFSSDSQVTASRSGNSIYLWEVDNVSLAPEPAYTLTAEVPVNVILYSQDNTALIAVEQGGEVIEIWNTDTYTRRHRLTGTIPPAGSYSQPSTQGNLVFTYGSIWNIQSGELEMTVPLNAILNADWSMGAYWDNHAVRIVHRDATPDSVLDVITNYQGQVAAFNANIGWVVFGNNGVTAYDLNTGELVFNHASQQVAFSEDGHYLLVNEPPADSASYSSLSIFDTANPTQPISQHEQVNLSVPILVSPNGQFLSILQGGGARGACGEGGGTVSVFDVTQNKYLFRWREGGCGPFSHAFSADNNWLIVGWDYSLAFINIAEASIEAEAFGNAFLPPSPNSVRYFSSFRVNNYTMSPDGTLIAFSRAIVETVNDEPVSFSQLDIFRFTDVIQNVTTGRQIEPVYVIPDATTLLFSPDNEYVATDNGLWHLESGEQIGVFDATVAAFNYDSSLLATYEQNTVTLWDVETLQNGHDIAELNTFNIQGVQSLAFNPDGTLLYIQRRGDVQVWGVR
jgi:WD40 repeat protein